MIGNALDVEVESIGSYWENRSAVSVDTRQAASPTVP